MIPPFQELFHGTWPLHHIHQILHQVAETNRQNLRSSRFITMLTVIVILALSSSKFLTLAMHISPIFNIPTHTTIARINDNRLLFLSLLISCVMDDWNYRCMITTSSHLIHFPALIYAQISGSLPKLHGI